MTHAVPVFHTLLRDVTLFLQDVTLGAPRRSLRAETPAPALDLPSAARRRGVRQRLLVVVFLSGLLLAGCAGEEPSYERDGIVVPFRTDGSLEFVRGGAPVVTIDIEIAETDSARARGLMQRTSLPERSGMLFIFDREETQSFWMANTPLALDILFVGADSQIVDVRKYTRPYSATNITSSASAQFVVEVPAGFADTHGILESDRVRWRRMPHPAESRN